MIDEERDIERDKKQWERRTESEREKEKAG